MRYERPQYFPVGMDACSEKEIVAIINEEMQKARDLPDDAVRQVKPLVSINTPDLGRESRDPAFVYLDVTKDKNGTLHIQLAGEDALGGFHSEEYRVPETQEEVKALAKEISSKSYEILEEICDSEIDIFRAYDIVLAKNVLRQLDIPEVPQDTELYFYVVDRIRSDGTRDNVHTHMTDHDLPAELGVMKDESLFNAVYAKAIGEGIYADEPGEQPDLCRNLMQVLRSEGQKALQASNVLGRDIEHQVILSVGKYVNGEVEFVDSTRVRTDDIRKDIRNAYEKATNPNVLDNTKPSKVYPVNEEAATGGTYEGVKVNVGDTTFTLYHTVPITDERPLPLIQIEWKDADTFGYSKEVTGKDAQLVEGIALNAIINSQTTEIDPVIMTEVKRWCQNVVDFAQQIDNQMEEGNYKQPIPLPKTDCFIQCVPRDNRFQISSENSRYVCCNKDGAIIHSTNLYEFAANVKAAMPELTKAAEQTVEHSIKPNSQDREAIYR